ncbi:hypothetical protein [Streptomyces sp. NPDC058545]
MRTSNWPQSPTARHSALRVTGVLLAIVEASGGDVVEARGRLVAMSVG